MAINPLLMPSGTRVIVSKLVPAILTDRSHARLVKSPPQKVNQSTFEGTRNDRFWPIPAIPDQRNTKHSSPKPLHPFLPNLYPLTAS